MKRTCLISSALALLTLAPSVASAEPGILYVPTEDVTLTPSGEPLCSGVGAPNSAVGCTGVVNAETMIPAYGGDMAALVAGLQAALDPFDVLITDVRPPEYISYTMMLPDTPFDSPSVTCSFGGINCSTLKRNGIVFMVDGTQNCMSPEIVHSALYAFGRASGLEGVINPMDVMNYPPDYTIPLTAYLDECSDRAHQWTYDDAGMMVGEANLECTSLDHTGMCPDDANGDPGQNSFMDLMEYYGSRTEDTEAPVLSNIVPEDGAVIMQGDPLIVDVDIMDADPVVGVRWTITSPGFMEIIGGEVFTQCTNDVCLTNWEDGPLKATDSDWSITLAGLPAADYAITLEAADYHGNVTEMVSYTVTIMEEESGSTGGGGTGADETGNATNDTAPFTSGQDGSSDGGDTSTQDDTGGGGCSCRTTPAPGGAVLMLLGLMGLGTLRRRW